MSEKNDSPDLFRTLSDEEFDKAPRLSKEAIEAMWARVKKSWCDASSAPRPLRKIRGRFYRRW